MGKMRPILHLPKTHLQQNTHSEIFEFQVQIQRITVLGIFSAPRCSTQAFSQTIFSPMFEAADELPIDIELIRVLATRFCRTGDVDYRDHSVFLEIDLDAKNCYARTRTFLMDRYFLMPRHSGVRLKGSILTRSEGWHDSI